MTYGDNDDIHMKQHLAISILALFSVNDKIVIDLQEYLPYLCSLLDSITSNEDQIRKNLQKYHSILHRFASPQQDYSRKQSLSSIQNLFVTQK